MPEREFDEATTESLLLALHAGRTIEFIARKHSITTRDLARWSATGAGADEIAALRALASARAALAVSKARAQAAVALSRIARSDDAKETARKACYDLLRLPESAAESRTPHAPDADDLTPEETRAWLEAFESLGKTSLDRAQSPAPGEAHE